MSPSEASISYCPSKLVETPFVVPLITILTPPKGTFCWSVTIPVTVIVCCFIFGGSKDDVLISVLGTIFFSRRTISFLLISKETLVSFKTRSIKSSILTLSAFIVTFLLVSRVEFLYRMLKSVCLSISLNMDSMVASSILIEIFPFWEYAFLALSWNRATNNNNAVIFIFRSILIVK